MEGYGYADQPTWAGPVYRFAYVHPRWLGDRKSAAVCAGKPPFGALLETPGHGAWRRTGEGQFDIHFTFLLQGASDGKDIGTDNVHLQVSLNSAGILLSGMFESTVKDPSGNALFTATGTFSATPI